MVSFVEKANWRWRDLVSNTGTCLINALTVHVDFKFPVRGSSVPKVRIIFRWSFRKSLN
jgi:hypothetical protein